MTCRLLWWSKSKPELDFQYGGRFGEFNAMSSHSLVSHCHKIHVIPSSKIRFVTAITITVTLSCSLLGKSRCLATVAKIFTFWNGTTPENVKHVIVGICVKFHAFITIWAIFAPYAWTIPKIQRRSEDRELNHVSNQTKTWYAFMKLRRSCGATAPPGDVYIAQCCYRCRREGVRKEQET